MKSNQVWLYAALSTIPFSAVAGALPTDAVFAASSFWYTPIPATITLHPNSANFVKEILRQKATYYQTVTINTRQYTSPVYTAESGVPTVNVMQWDCQKRGYSDASLAEQWSAVPIPSYCCPIFGH